MRNVQIWSLINFTNLLPPECRKVTKIGLTACQTCRFQTMAFSLSSSMKPQLQSGLARTPAHPGFRAVHPLGSLQSQVVLFWDSTFPGAELSCPTKRALASLHNTATLMPRTFLIHSSNYKCLRSQASLIPFRITCP